MARFTCWHCGLLSNGAPYYWASSDAKGDLTNHKVHERCWLLLRKKYLGVEEKE